MQINLTHEGKAYVAWTPAQLTAAGVPHAPILDALKTALKAAIDYEAERQRLRWITPGAGQAMTYARKVEEAKVVQVADEADPEEFPLLAASIGIDGDDIEAVAATVLAMDTAWAQTGAAIEGARLGAKRDVDHAEDIAAAIAVSPAWPD